MKAGSFVRNMRFPPTEMVLQVKDIQHACMFFLRAYALKTNEGEEAENSTFPKSILIRYSKYFLRAIFAMALKLHDQGTVADVSLKYSFTRRKEYFPQVAVGSFARGYKLKWRVLHLSSVVKIMFIHFGWLIIITIILISISICLCSVEQYFFSSKS